jgi:hypothetical protein
MSARPWTLALLPPLALALTGVACAAVIAAAAVARFAVYPLVHRCFMRRRRRTDVPL